ncbi:hypothetical protein D3C76_1441410 [compost metagenome]
MARSLHPCDSRIWISAQLPCRRGGVADLDRWRSVVNSDSRRIRRYLNSLEINVVQVVRIGFQDRGINPEPMPPARRSRLKNRDEPARLQAAYLKECSFSFGIDFQPDCLPSGNHSRPWHRDIKRLYACAPSLTWSCRHEKACCGNRIDQPLSCCICRLLR